MSCFTYTQSLSYDQKSLLLKHSWCGLVDSWLDLTLSCLHDQPALNRKTARRGKRLLSNWGYVCRSQTAVDFEIRALQLIHISRLQVASGKGTHCRVSALIRSHCINISRCFTQLRFTTYGREQPSLFRRPRQTGPWADAPDGARASPECRGNSLKELGDQKLRVHTGPGRFTYVF